MISLIPHLNVQTCYSLLSSIITFKNYFDYAIKNNLSSLSICDNNMFGVYEFHQLCIKNKIKPIIGLNIIVLFNNFYYNINLISCNQKGYFNLIKISSLIMIDDKYKKNTTILDKIIEFLITDIKIIINYTINNFNYDFYKKIKKNIKEKKNLYLGINYTNIILLKSLKMIIEYNQIIWNNKIKYLKDEDFITYKIINTIKKQILFKENKIKNLYGWNQLPNFCQKYFENIKTLINSIDIFSLNKKNIFNNLLRYPITNNQTSNKFLYKICKISLKQKKNIKNKKIYINRLNYELKIINKMDFNDYFLIVWDCVRFAKKQNIFISPGRGSSSSSLVSYLLNITSVDPIVYNLFFERFLNPEKKNLPDIDIDFEDNKREIVIKYLFEKYGVEHVAYIITFQKIGIKTAIKDICKIFNITTEEKDKINKIIPLEYNYNYEKTINSNPIFEIYKKKYPQVFLNLKKIINLPKQIGTHPSGIILTQQKIQTIIPIKIGYNGNYQSQYSMDFLKKMRILKIDLLGLNNLTILHNIIDNIYKEKKIKLNINNISLNDEKTYKLLSKGYTKGIFQLESTGITKILIDIIPDKLEDIISAISLYRPSSYENIKLFIQRKKKIIKINYIDKRLYKILFPTYGIILYQEQIIQIVKEVTNFSLAKSDIIRQAIVKKKLLIINKIKNEFIKKAIKNNYVKKTAKKIWELIYKFTEYGFNRSHAVTYSLLCYQMAYLKTNYLSQFLTSLLTYFIGDKNKTNEYIFLAKKNNFIIKKPNINKLYKQYKNINNKIYIPLLIINKIDFLFFNKIIKELQNNGIFTDLYNLFIRLYKKGLNKKNYEALCFSGALDIFKINRISLFNNYKRIKNYIELIKIKENNENLIVNFSLVEKPELVIESDNEIFCLEKEYEFLGFYLSNHPINYVRKKEGYQNKTVLINNLKLNLKIANILVLIKKIKIIIDKNNNKMVFLKCCDESGEINITAFSKIYKKYFNLLKINNILLLNIKLEKYNKKINGIINKIKFIINKKYLKKIN